MRRGASLRPAACSEKGISIYPSIYSSISTYHLYIVYMRRRASLRAAARSEGGIYLYQFLSLSLSLSKSVPICVAVHHSGLLPVHK